MLLYLIKNSLTSIILNTVQQSPFTKMYMYSRSCTEINLYNKVKTCTGMCNNEGFIILLKIISLQMNAVFYILF